MWSEKQLCLKHLCQKYPKKQDCRRVTVCDFSIDVTGINWASNECLHTLVSASRSKSLGNERVGESLNRPPRPPPLLFPAGVHHTKGCCVCQSLPARSLQRGARTMELLCTCSCFDKIRGSSLFRSMKQPNPKPNTNECKLLAME